MNVLFAANDALVDGLELAIWTLLHHNKGIEINIYVATMSLTIYPKDDVARDYRAIDHGQREWLKKIVAYKGQGLVNICFIDCQELYHQYLEKSVNYDTGFTPFASLRLIADVMLPDIDDLLYLDADIAIQGSLEGMYHKYIEDNPYELAASYAYDAFNGKGELVSGVLVMNLAKMRKTGFLGRARKIYNTEKFLFPDQMALQLAGPCTRLPETYGYINELEKCYYTPVILHFTDKLLPKIYLQSIPNAKEYFFKRYPQFKYVQDGMELLKKLDITI